MPVGKGFDKLDRWGHLVLTAANSEPGDAASKSAGETIKDTHAARGRAISGDTE